jgi:hypothetical protein
MALAMEMVSAVAGAATALVETDDKTNVKASKLAWHTFPSVLVLTMINPFKFNYKIILMRTYYCSQAFILTG